MMKPRQCVVVMGDRAWCSRAAAQLLATVRQDHICCISDSPSDYQHHFDQGRAKSLLGQEFDAIIYDGLESIHADSLGICLGTIRAGGMFLLFLSEATQSKRWLQRFQRIIWEYEQAYDGFKLVKQGEELPQISFDNEVRQHYQTDDQTQAIEAIKHVVTGHRKRPLVLSADRGRGKSAALGIAAAELVLQGKKTILITAPSFATAAVAFDHGKQVLAKASHSKTAISLDDAIIKFIAPDELINTRPDADLVLVDEAAAIPVAMLTQLVKHYSRLVFASTIHGYEGTGRGFAIRFQSILEQQTPGWRSMTLNTPIRWLQNDPVEQFGFDALLLNATAAEDDDVESASLEACTIEKLDRHSLVDDEITLRQVFGLMVLAHYRTRPSDLQMMLDRKDIELYVMRYQKHIVGTAWLVTEGPLDAELSKAVFMGQRRIKGQLMPQSLIQHVGIENAGKLRYQRIMRIAIHPKLQQQGFARHLLNHIKSDVVEQQFDVVGASFSASSDLLKFWQKTGYQLAYIGVQCDHVSAAHTVIMLQALSDRGRVIIAQSQQRLKRQWSELLLYRFNHIEPEQVLLMAQCLAEVADELSESDRAEINSFVDGQRSYEVCQFVLRHYLLSQLARPRFMALNQQQQQLLIKRVVQNQSWSSVAEYFSLAGKSAVITELKQALKQLVNEEKA